jgi:probable HAF family extracellular repeat protein
MKKAYLLASALCLLAGVASAAPTTYTYTDIVIPGFGVYPTAVSATGTVLGNYYDTSFTEHGFIYQNGTITSFDPPNSLGTTPSGINAKGEIVGSFFDSNYTQHGFILNIGSTGTQTFTVVDYAGSPGFAFTGIDKAGLLFGDAAGANNAQLLVTYAKKHFTTLIGANDPALYSVSSKGNLAGAYAIYPAGQFYPNFAAFVDVAGTQTAINVPNAVNSVAYGINDSGTAVGYSSNASGVETGFIFANGTLTTVAAPGATSSYLSGVNDSGHMVGVAFDASYNETSYMYFNGKYSPISVPGGVNTGAFAINAPGQVIGTYIDATGNQQVFLATPVK